MKLPKELKRFIKKFDLFSQQVSFRYNQEPVYESLTGGCVSIMVIFALIGVFMSTFISTFRKQSITYNESKYDDENPTFFSTQINNTFMFALGIQGLNLNDGFRYFDVSLQFRNYYKNNRSRENIPLYPCKFQQWENMGFGQSYNSLQFSHWLCTDQNLTLQLQGKFTSETFKFYRIIIEKCVPSRIPSRPCIADSVIQTYLNEFQVFNFNFYFVNTILNPGNQKYIRRFLDDGNYVPFSKTQGINGNLFISSYTVQTDQSLLPIQQINVQTGGIATQLAQLLTYQVRNKQYVKFYLRKSPISILIQRQFRRIDDTLSYIGGLFSSILSILGIVCLYNELSYELEMANNLYFYQKNEPIQTKGFNFFTFLVFMIYNLMQKIGIQPDWQKYKKIHISLESIKKQLDIRVVMKKVLYAEKLGDVLLDEHKHKALHLQEPMTLDDAQKIRHEFNFYNKMRYPDVQEDKTINEFNQNLKINITEDQLYTQMADRSLVGKIGVDLSTEKSKSKELTLEDQFLNFSKNKVYPEIFMERSHSQNSLKKKVYLSGLDREIIVSLLKIKAESQRGDLVALRIFNKIDTIIKDKLIGQKNIINQRKLNPFAGRKLAPIIIQNELQQRMKSLQQIQQQVEGENNKNASKQADIGKD